MDHLCRCLCSIHLVGAIGVADGTDNRSSFDYNGNTYIVLARATKPVSPRIRLSSWLEMLIFPLQRVLQRLHRLIIFGNSPLQGFFLTSNSFPSQVPKSSLVPHRIWTICCSVSAQSILSGAIGVADGQGY